MRLDLIAQGATSATRAARFADDEPLEAAATAAARSAWDAEPGGRYAVRGGSLIAWFLPEGAPAWRPFRIVGSHTD